MDILFTKHSRKRMQQRGITENAIKYLIEYGELKFDGHGGKQTSKICKETVANINVVRANET